MKEAQLDRRAASRIIAEAQVFSNIFGSPHLSPHGEDRTAAAPLEGELVGFLQSYDANLATMRGAVR